MMKFWRILYLFQIFFAIIKCDIKKGIKSENKLPYFRRNIDDLGNLGTKDPRSESDDLQGHIVSFLINNVQEIFSDNDEISEFSVSPLPLRNSAISARSTNPSTTIEEDTKLTDDVKGYKNVTLSTRVNIINPPVSTEDIKKAKHSQMLLLSESTLKKSEQKLVLNNSYIHVSSLAPEPVYFVERSERGRSCIFCNNVMHEDCDNPTNKLIPSVVCDHDGDECYSLHTPFGIVDRGCYNINRNLSIYVCACNLCNYLSITEMPYVFSNKREWVHNVVELSRVRNLRKSVFKDMACLSCEVNTTKSKTGAPEENCLEGKIGKLNTEVCNDGEVCAVKVIKGEGYVWRGCVRTPLYNYWWNVCDRDLCNIDSLVSLHDYL